jgi:carbon storage regulator
MLVITRSTGESFRIGEDVEVLIAGTNGVSVKLGVEDPRHAQVHRSEVYERIAASSSGAEEEC